MPYLEQRWQEQEVAAVLESGVRLQDINERLHEVDFAQHFTNANFEAKIKQINGYQAHIASPEMAMRAVVADAFESAAPIAQWMVIQVKTFLAAAAREAANEVLEKDPERREQLSDAVVQVCPPPPPRVAAARLKHCALQTRC